MSLESQPPPGMVAGLTRRALLQRGGMLAVAAFLAPGCGRSEAPAAVVPVGQGGARFLGDAELATLRALVDRFIPGPPEDPDPGAVEAGCAEAIDALLGAFGVDPPRIYAGGPFSDRGGAARNDFAQFIPLDPYEELAWRLRIEGSQGRPEREFNGPVTGLQQIYREGLAALEATIPGFATLPGPARELALRASQEAAVLALINVAFPQTLELMYGAPEYGGNRDLAGWRYTGFDGDTQPRGYTDAQVENPDQAGPQDGLPALPVGVPLESLLALAPLASYEGAQTVLQGGMTLDAMTAGLAPVLAAGSAGNGQ